MKNLLTLICFTCLIGIGYSQNTSKTTNDFEEVSSQYKNRSPIYDYSENQLNNTDTIPDFEIKPNKLKITGTIFQEDGITPAKDVILYIYQPDDNGKYETKTYNHKRYIHHRGWIKTNADGQYTFYTFIPGASIVPLTYPRTRGLKYIYPVIKESGKPEYDHDVFVFEDDPLLTDRCRSKLERKGFDGFLKLEKIEGMHVATRDIILNQNPLANK